MMLEVNPWMYNWKGFYVDLAFEFQAREYYEPRGSVKGTELFFWVTNMFSHSLKYKITNEGI